MMIWKHEDMRKWRYEYMKNKYMNIWRYKDLNIEEI